jgi:hypothetical protein
MRKTVTASVLLCCASFFAAGIGCTAKNDVRIVKDGLVKRLCYESYWGLGGYPRKPVPIKIRIDRPEKTFHIWINDFEVTETYHMADYLSGILRDKDAVVLRHSGYNIELRPPHRGYLEHRPLFDGEGVVEDILEMPADCTPHYDPTTPKKELMLSTVIKTVQYRLEDFARMGIAKYPRELTLIIADFNIDYPMTYVLVEQTNKVYTITLHDFQDYESDEYERMGEYPFGERYKPAKSLIEKIRKHGIRKKIALE